MFLQCILDFSLRHATALHTCLDWAPLLHTPWQGGLEPLHEVAVEQAMGGADSERRTTKGKVGREQKGECRGMGHRGSGSSQKRVHDNGATFRAGEVARMGVGATKEKSRRGCDWLHTRTCFAEATNGSPSCTTQQPAQSGLKQED